MVRSLVHPEISRTRQVVKTLARCCSICGHDISIKLNSNRTYRGGHYFGKVPKVSKTKMNMALKAGSRPVRIGSQRFQVLNRDPKPSGYFEYWECGGCYNGSVQK